MNQETYLPHITSPEPPTPELVLDRTKPDFEKQIDELVGALTDPIIVWPIGGWGETLPKKIKDDIQLHRLSQLMKRETGVATWPEVCAYLYTVSLERPIAHEWVNIYMYAMTQYMGDKFPPDLKKDKLDPYEERLLREFRVWLWNARHKARLDKGRAAQRQDKEAQRLEQEESCAEAPQQSHLF